MYTTIPSAAVWCMTVSGILCLILPILAFWLIRRRFGLQARAVVAGAVAFLLFKLVIETLVTNLMEGALAGLASNVYLYTLYTCLAVGVFEETARLCAFATIGKYDMGVRTAFSAGFGHAAAQALFLSALAMFASATTANMVNAGTLGDTAQGMGAVNMESLQQTIDLYASTPPLDFLSTAVDAIAKFPLQVMLAAPVYLAATRQGPFWLYPAAVFLHAAASIPAQLYQYGAIASVWESIVYAWLITAGVLMVIWRLCKRHSVLFDETP